MNKNIYDVSKDELLSFLSENSFKSFRYKQIQGWLKKLDCNDFGLMKNLPKQLKKKLSDNFFIESFSKTIKQKSKDGSIKYAIELLDKNYIEAVLIPAEKRVTLCVSSQVGCSLDCSFCATAKIKRQRNLEPSEIINQIKFGSREAIKNYGKKVTNIVYMGMGEPLLNYKNVIKSIRYATNKELGLELSNKKITLSTVGIPKMITKLSEENLGINLAVSLHSADNKIRSEIMNINNKNNIKDIMISLENWYRNTKSKITFEYVLIDKKNDDFNNANKLVKLARQIPSKVNLIELNEIKHSSYKKSNKNSTQKFYDILKQKKVPVTIRYSKGGDIDAACGQLALKK